MTAKRLFVGRKTVEDRFIIINDYENEIGVKENRSGDVIVLKHSDLNAQQFVAQLVVFLNDQNQAIVDLYDGSKYWSDKATEKIKELEKENEQLKKALLFFYDVANCECSINWKGDMEKGCKRFFNCTYEEAEEKYGDYDGMWWELE